MYTLNVATGIISRDSDSVVVSPVNDAANVDYQAYIAWCLEGNSPAEIGGDFLQQRQIEIWEAIKNERDRRKHAGVKVGTTWFHSDSGSRTQQLGLVIAGAGIPADLPWKTLTAGGGLYGSVYVTMTPTLAQQIFGATMVHDSTFHQAAEVHKANMLLLDDPYSYDYLVNWPLSFEDVV